MRRRPAAVLLAGAVVTLLAPVVADARRHRPHRPPRPTLPRAAAIAEREWDVHASRPRVAAGPVSLTVTNDGEDDHDLTVAGPAGSVGQVLLGPGETATLRVDLEPGRYRLYCSLPGHEALGMATTIRAG